MEWIKQYIGEAPTTPAQWLVIAILGAILLILLHSLYRRLSGGMYISGGRSRKARLAVMDAAPVDNHRRLVLVRRDDVEHLVMIGGGTDFVIEQNIRIGASASRPRSVVGDAPAPAPAQEATAPAVQAAAQDESDRRRPVPHPAQVSAPPTAESRFGLRRPNRAVLTAVATTAAAPAAKPAEPSATQPAAGTHAAASAPVVAVDDETITFDVEPVAIEPKAAAPAVVPQVIAPVEPPAIIAVEPVVEAPKITAIDEARGKAAAPPGELRRARIFGSPKSVAAPVPTLAPAATAAVAATPKRDDLEDEMERLLNELTGTNS